mmetsp:Transcript_62653/g.103323  ORF Transcript_62653/g.103323 Transcript_62653/m.103323 type:complete len:82 (+) Transcript_62653:242-487(+)
MALADSWQHADSKHWMVFVQTIPHPRVEGLSPLPTCERINRIEPQFFEAHGMPPRENGLKLEAALQIYAFSANVLQCLQAL